MGLNRFTRLGHGEVPLDWGGYYEKIFSTPFTGLGLAICYSAGRDTDKCKISSGNKLKKVWSLGDVGIKKKLFNIKTPTPYESP